MKNKRVVLQKLREGKLATNLDQYISNTVLKQFAYSKKMVLNTDKRAKVLYMQELYVDYINKENFHFSLN